MELKPGVYKYVSELLLNITFDRALEDDGEITGAEITEALCEACRYLTLRSWGTISKVD